MAKKRISRKELLNKPDEFLTFSAKAVMFIRAHSRQFEYLGVAIGVMVILYLGFNAYMSYINKKGLEAYNEAYYAFSKDVGPDADQKKLDEDEALFQKVTKEYSLTRVSKLAYPGEAYIKFREKKYDEAISLYQEFLKKVSDSEDASYQSLARIALATCYEEKKEYAKSIEMLENLSTGPDTFLKEEAMLDLARVYRLAQKPEKAVEILKKFTDTFKTSPFLPLAKAQLEKLS